MQPDNYTDIETYLQTLETRLDRDNSQAIRLFINGCAAGGASEARQFRDAQLLPQFVTSTPTAINLLDATSAEMADALVALNGSCYHNPFQNDVKRVLTAVYRG